MSTSASTSFSFTSGGIDVSSIVSQLMTAERAPLQLIQTRQQSVTTQQTTLTGVTGGLSTLSADAADIVASGVAKLTTSTSDSTIVSSAITGSAIAGSVNFTVDQLASTDGWRTATVPSTSSSIVSSPTLAISGSAAAHGITGLSADATVPLGKYTITVKQGTSGASVSGSGALGSSTTVDGTNNTLSLVIDGTTKNVTIASGTYSPANLVKAVQAGIDAAGGGVVTSLDPTGHLKLTTVHEGSTATLGVQASTALANLGLPVTFPATMGTDGILQIGTNPPVTVLSAGMLDSLTVSTGTGNLTLKLGGGLRTGDSTVAVVSTGDGSLTSVTNAINNAGIGVSASAVQAGSNSYLLQLNANASGTANAISTDSAAFTPAGGLIQTSAAQDAKLTVGTGPGAYTVTGNGSAFANLLQGVTITASKLSSTPVTVSVGRDDNATADKVGKLITDANALLATLDTATKYDASTNTVAPLADNSTVRGLAAQLRSAITNLVPGSTTQLAGNIGINVQQDGTIKFDRSAFLTALAADPTGVESLFSRHGSASNGLSFVSATDSTLAGNYAVNVTQAATRATSGEVLVGGSTSGQTINVRVGTTVASYQAAAGATAAQIASGLSSALAQSGMKVAAAVTSGGGVQLTSTVFGLSGAFDVNLDASGAGSYQSYSGKDVQGTINGKQASGIGNRLTMFDLGSDAARGIKVDVGEGLTGALGTVNYTPGIAARLVNLQTTLTSVFGALTTSASGYDQQIKDFNTQIDDFNTRMTQKEADLRAQWTNVQTALTSLTNQQSWLTAQTAKM